MNEKGLLRLKEEIDEKKTKVAELKGKREHLLDELEKNYNCSSVEEAEKLHEKMNREIAQLDKTIQKNIEEIEEKYDV